MARRFFCLSLMRDTASAALRCATCDTIAAEKFIPRVQKKISVPDRVLERIEPSRLALLRMKLCRYVFRQFLGACGMNREQMWYKIRPWLPGIMLTVMLMVALRAN